MKKLKTLSIVATLAVITVHVSAQSKEQGQANPKTNPVQIAQKMTTGVKQVVTGITPDQESKIQAVELEYIKAVQNAPGNTNNGNLHRKMQSLHDIHDAKIKAILTADQYTQYQKTYPSVNHNKAGK